MFEIRVYIINFYILQFWTKYLQFCRSSGSYCRSFNFAHRFPSLEINFATTLKIITLVNKKNVLLCVKIRMLKFWFKVSKYQFVDVFVIFKVFLGQEGRGVEVSKNEVFREQWTQVLKISSDDLVSKIYLCIYFFPTVSTNIRLYWKISWKLCLSEKSSCFHHIGNFILSNFRPCHFYLRTIISLKIFTFC